MGGCCGGSSGPKEASDEEKQDICAKMAKEMMLISVEPALLNADKIKIPMPEGLDNLKKASADLKDKAARARRGSGVGVGEAGAEAKEGGEDGAKAAKGSVMGMMDKAAGFMQKGAEKAAEIGGQGAAVALEGVAAILDQAVAAVEEPMTDAGKDVIEAKKAEVTKVLRDHIERAKVEGAVELCKGPSNLISDYLVMKTSGDIVPQLLTEIDQALVDHKGIKAWGAAIKQYDALADKLPPNDQLKPVNIDIKRYICEQTVIGIGTLMAEEEAKIRAEPAGKAQKFKSVFVKVFSGQMLTVEDHKLTCGPTE